MDVLAAEGGRALVALDHSVAVVGRGYARLVVGMRARLAESDGAVLFLDLGSGVIWGAMGLEKLGDKAADEVYVTELLVKARSVCKAESGCPERAEAERLIGHPVGGVAIPSR